MTPTEKMSPPARFISKKTPQEYIAEHYLSWKEEFSTEKRWRVKLKRWLTKAGVHVATCLFKSNSRPEKLSPDKLSRVLVLRYDLLGDMILTTAVFNALKSLNPNVDIDVLASNKNADIIESDARLSKIFLFSRRWSFLKTAMEIRRRRHDLVLSFIQVQSSTDALLSMALAPTALKSSVKRKMKYRPYFDFLANESVGEAHMVEKLLSTVINAVHAPSPETFRAISPSISIDADAMRVARRWLDEMRLSKFVVANLSAGQPYREWPREKYIEWIRSAIAISSLGVVLVSTEARAADARFIASSFPNEPVYAFPTAKNLSEIAALTSLATVVFTPDTAIVHLASALKRPVLGLYTIMGTIPQEWTPYRVPYRALLADGHVPVSTIRVDDAVAAFIELYQEIQASGLI